MRFSDSLRTARKSFSRQPGRTLLTVTAMAISATILMALASISLGLSQAATATLTPDANMNTVVVTPTRTADTASVFGGAQEVSQGQDVLTDATLGTLRTTPHVVSATPVAEVWELKSFQIQGSDKTFVAQAAGVQSNQATNRPVAAGMYFGPDSADHSVVLGYGYARELGLAPAALIGKTISITTQNGYVGDGADIPQPTWNLQQLKDYANHATILQATVVGVLKQGTDDSRIYLPMNWARAIRTQRSVSADATGRTHEQQTDQIAKDGYSSILVQTDAPANVQSVVDAASKLGVGAISTLSQLKKIMQFAAVIWVGLGAIALVTLLAGALGIANTMLTAVAEQRYAIGVWRACGATKGVVGRMFIMQAALMGFFGGVIGAGLSFLLAHIANDQLARILTAQNLAVVPVAAMPWWLMALGVGVTMVFAVLAGAYPAWRAASQEPSRALSGE